MSPWCKTISPSVLKCSSAEAKSCSLSSNKYVLGSSKSLVLNIYGISAEGIGSETANNLSMFIKLLAIFFSSYSLLNLYSLLTLGPKKNQILLEL